MDFGVTSSGDQTNTFDGSNSCASLQSVLIVDDSASQRKMLSILLRKWGYDVTTASSGHDALALYRENPTAFVISDWMMPGLTGPELCQQVRGIKERGYTYFIILTSKAKKADIADGLNSGADDYLSKPVDKDELFARLTAGRRIVQLQHRIEHIALYDELTKLPNRTLFQESLGKALQHVDNNGNNMGLLLIDVDNFKTVNDTYGHNAGDDLLVDFAKRLTACTRKSDLVARLGGDEFAIIVNDVKDTQNVVKVAERAQDILRRKFSHGTTTTMVSASIGVATYPGSGDTAIELLKNADIALYEAKALGRARYAVFDSVLAESALVKQTELALVQSAIENQEIIPYFQPIVDAANHRIVGFEALARHVTRDGKVNLPSSFAVAFNDGVLSRAIDNAIIACTMGHLRDWADKQIKVGRVSINVSSSQIADEGFCHRFIDDLASNNISPESVAIEITENVVLSNDRGINIAGSLSFLSDAGVGIDFDDFGTGYASLSHLSSFHFDRIKIDRSFVADLPGDNQSLGIVKAIVVLAKHLEKQIVAEGVETTEQAELLHEVGCDFLQGFLFSKAVSAREVEKLMRDQSVELIKCA